MTHESSLLVKNLHGHGVTAPERLLSMNTSHALDGPVSQNATAAGIHQAIRAADDRLHLAHSDHPTLVLDTATRCDDLALGMTLHSTSERESCSTHIPAALGLKRLLEEKRSTIPEVCH